MAGWIILFIIVAAAFVVLHALLLPKIFLSAGYKNIPEGYEPEELAKKYIIFREIALKDGKKCLTCGYAEGVKSLDYDIVTYDETGGIYKVINVKENFVGETAPREIILPKHAANTRFMINSVNGETVLNKRANDFGITVYAAYFLCCAALEFVAAIAAVHCAAHAISGIYAEAFSSFDVEIALLVSAVIFICDLVFTLLYIKLSKKPRTVAGRRSDGGAAYKTFKSSAAAWIFTILAVIAIIIAPCVEAASFGKNSNYFTANGVRYVFSTENSRDVFAVDITSSGEATIPASVGAYRVSRILALNSEVRQLTVEGDPEILSGAFQGCKMLASVIMNGVSEIPDRAFYGCKSLVRAEIRGALKIGSYAFYGCENLESVRMKISATVGLYAFGQCGKLTYIYG